LHFHFVSSGELETCHPGSGNETENLGAFCPHIAHFQFESDEVYEGTYSSDMQEFSSGKLLPEYPYFSSHNFLPLDKFDENLPTASGYRGFSTGALGETLAST
jgi:hypothetical protein